MNSLTRIMSYDKTKNENQENCNCEECIGIDDVSKKKEIIENFNYDNFLIKIKNHQLICKEKEFLTILNLRYWYKDEKTKKFIWKALHIHGDKYDYYKTIYIKSKEKIQIECKNKHCFLQTPHDHLGGHGCKKCQHEKLAKEQTLKLEEFIIQANSVHGFGRYDYSKVKYVNYQTKVCIICKEHGNKDYEFWQTPHNHLNGVGCPLCGIKKRNESKKLTTEEFIKQAIEIHGFLYDYSKTEYKNYNTLLCIICKNHEKPYEFWQTPHSHLRGSGCPLCNGTKKLTLEEFIERARKIHGNKYDYSKVVYKNNFTKVCIICNNHGKPFEFWQTPKDHLHAHGCFKCESSKGEFEIVKFLTKIDIKFEEQKTFEKCRYKNKLRFDFYLPEYNLCIEFDGIQHFVPTDFTSKSTNEEIMKNFKLTQLRDQIKNDYCKKNGINLLRIRYDENVEEKLTEYFQKHRVIKEQTLFDMVS